MNDFIVHPFNLLGILPIPNQIHVFSAASEVKFISADTIIISKKQVKHIAKKRIIMKDKCLQKGLLLL